MKAVLLPVLLLATLLQGSDSQGKMGYGNCPDVKPKHPFSLSQFKGYWYEYSTYGGDGKGKCVKSEFVFDPDTLQNKFTKTQKSLSTNKNEEVTGTVYNSDLLNPYEGALIMTVNKPGEGRVETDYWILGTDYSSFAVAYACTSSMGYHFKSSWILTRDRSPSIKLGDINPIISKIGLRMNDYKITIQAGC